ncbi:ABC transporter permease [Treponema sp. HNW]|uniref:ABC transporter permease n=1 Tax=Treponema sp. HNW TaxID=3116654 RepID=UPI003D1407F8
MKKLCIKNYDVKKNGAVLLAVTMTGIFFSLFVNIAYSSYSSKIASLKERFPYDAVTRKSYTQEVRSLIAAHKNVKETRIIRDLISIRHEGVLCTLEEAEGSMLTRDALIEGKFPKDNTELIISTEFKERFGLGIGDTLSVTAGKRIVRLKEGGKAAESETSAETGTEEGNERIVPAGEYPAKGEAFRPEGERSFTITGIFKNNRTTVAANPNVKTSALGDAFKDGRHAKIALVFANKWKGYKTVKDLASLIEPETEDFRNVFFVNDLLLAVYGAFDRKEISIEQILTVTLFPLYLAVGTVLVFVLMLKNIYGIWAFNKIRTLAMYKSIGSSRKQLKKLVVKEALKQALPAAFFSLIPGNILSFLIIEFIKGTEKNAQHQIVSSYNFSITMNLIAGVFVFICVALSASIPARKLSRMGIIEALKGGFELKKDKRKRQAKSLEKELRKNNFTLFKASTALVTFSLSLIFFILLMETGLHVERNYWKTESVYNFYLFLRTHRKGIPEPFQRLQDKFDKKDYLIYTQKYAFMYPETFLSDEFKKKGFYKKAEGKLFKRENGKAVISVFFTGLLPDDFKKLTGHSDYRGIVVLNSVRKNFEDEVSKAQYIPYFDESVKSLPITLYGIGSTGSDMAEKEFVVEKYIMELPQDFLDDRNEIASGYDAVVFIPAEELDRLLHEHFTPKNEYDYTFTQYFMNIRTEEHKNTPLADENYYNNLLKNYVQEEERFSVEGEQLHSANKSESDVLSLLLYSVCAVCTLITLATVYAAVNMFFARRKREIFLLKSCGIREAELKALLMRDYFYFMLRSVLYAVPLCTGLTLWYGTLSISFTFKRFLIYMNYPVLAVLTALIASAVYLFFRLGAKRFQGMNIAEEVRE